MSSRILSAVLLALAAYAIPSPSSPPTVALDKGTFTGVYNSTTGTNQFLGIPFAQPPIGDLRFNLPVPSHPYEGSNNATSFGFACYGQSLFVPFPHNVTTAILDLFIGAPPAASEDCLSVNVFQPAGLSKDVLEAKLPVVVWIYGGGFESGASASYSGAPMVSFSSQLGKPIIYVSFNYRLSAFGWIAGKEVKEAGVGNIGLHDQRLALRWVQKYISAFGGDPNKVTIWGESAGAISVAYQMVANNGDNEGLFRGAIMDSGSIYPVGDITRGQKLFDSLVEQTGCAKSKDALACLRTAPLDTILTAVGNVPTFLSNQSLNVNYGPAADGTFITEAPQNLVQTGRIARVPIINGDVDDEGTLFTLSLQNITTDQEVHDYLSSNYFVGAKSSEVDKVMTLYPQNYTAGSPFDTGLLNALTPQYKRLAAIQGDLIFQSSRRFLLQHVSHRQTSWSFLSKRFKSDPILGSCHISDLIDALFTQGDLMEYFIYFIHDLNPNGGKLPSWPTYTTASPHLLTLQDNASDPIFITQDTYRKEGMAYLNQLLLKYPLGL